LQERGFLLLPAPKLGNPTGSNVHSSPSSDGIV